MNIISKTNLWLSISAIVIIASLACVAVFGLRLGIDFTGGSLLEVQYAQNRPPVNEIRANLDSLGLGSFNIQPIGETGVVLRFRDVNEDDHQRILEALRAQVSSEDTAAEAGSAVTNEELQIETDSDSGLQLIGVNQEAGDESVAELRFESVGPSIGAELKQKSFYAAFIVLILIIAYIAYSFRKVSRPVASWKYGVAAVVALFHDVLLVMGIFALLGRFAGVEIDTAFVAAILTVLGYSVNDTIVVFDRIRENLPRSAQDFAGTVNTSLQQTFGRSLNTSLTTLLVLIAIYLFGGETIRYFTLALIIGIAAGTYSSLFLASPLVVAWEKFSRK